MKKEAKKLDELTIKKLNPKMWRLLYEKNVKKQNKSTRIQSSVIIRNLKTVWFSDLHRRSKQLLHTSYRKEFVSKHSFVTFGNLVELEVQQQKFFRIKFSIHRKME